MQSLQFNSQSKKMPAAISTMNRRGFGTNQAIFSTGIHSQTQPILRELARGLAHPFRTHEVLLETF
jgi:hypothetical protein